MTELIVVVCKLLRIYSPSLSNCTSILADWSVAMVD